MFVQMCFLCKRNYSIVHLMICVGYVATRLGGNNEISNGMKKSQSDSLANVPGLEMFINLHIESIPADFSLPLKTRLEVRHCRSTADRQMRERSEAPVHGINLTQFPLTQTLSARTEQIELSSK